MRRVAITIALCVTGFVVLSVMIWAVFGDTLRTLPTAVGVFVRNLSPKAIGTCFGLLVIVVIFLLVADRIPKSQRKPTYEADQVPQTGEADQEHKGGEQVVKRSWLGGRPRYPENEWAYKQVNKEGRKPDEVYPEWLEMAGERVKTLESTPKEVFKKAIKPK